MKQRELIDELDPNRDQDHDGDRFIKGLDGTRNEEAFKKIYDDVNNFPEDTIL